MAIKVILDAMIKRADFDLQAETSQLELIDKITMDHISGSSPVLRLLRKPDFQRETNHWSPDQIASLVSSYASGELIPSLILWKADSFVFVIDGAHRLSALKAWVLNDYGDGRTAFDFFGGNITDEQKRNAEKTRRLVEKRVGRFSDFKAMTEEELSAGSENAKMASTIFTRSLHVQWIQGSREVAETSFFKINSQGTTLDAVEEMLLKNRNSSYAIAARSIVRSGTGHKYWSSFESDQQSKIEEESSKLNKLLFQPDLKEPIKTLDLPLGGTSSPVDALKMLIDIFTIVDGETDPKKTIEKLPKDTDGTETLDILRRTKRVVSRITGNDASSLGFHPAVYFYNEKGKHSRFLFLGVLKAVAESVRTNKDWFKYFTAGRKEIEEALVSRKSVINQGLANVSSRQRIDRVATLIKNLVAQTKRNKSIDDQLILSSLGLEGSVSDLKLVDQPVGFSTSIKSAVLLRKSLTDAPSCEQCGGYLDMAKSISYDHIVRIRDGGKGDLDNAQILHPFCNSGIKN